MGTAGRGPAILIWRSAVVCEAPAAAGPCVEPLGLLRLGGTTQRSLSTCEVLDLAIHSLTIFPMPDTLSGTMKSNKTASVTAREAQRHMAKVIDALRPGQSVQIIRHGQAVASLQKGPARKIRLPNILKRLQRHPYPAEVGEAVIRQFHETVS
jgi:antitoxin (DNA-binding transcriptional repressor) of toxin-antitoxin stability system